MNNRRLIAGALSASLLVSALPGLALAQDEAASFAAESQNWALDTLNGEPVPEEVEVTLFLSGGEAVGNAGCNSYFGSYEIDETSLTFPQPFGSTQMFCEGPQQDTENVYLPTLQTTAGWTVDEAGMLRLTDADGAETLIYSPADEGGEPVEVTTTDVDALVAELVSLQAQIDDASAAVVALAEEASSINVNKFDKRLSAVEKSTKQLDNKVAGISSENLRKRIVALEETTGRLDKTIDRFRERIIVLEESSKDHEDRISALEEEA